MSARAGIGEQQILRRVDAAAGGSAAPSSSALRPAGLLGPQPLGVAGEPSCSQMSRQRRRSRCCRTTGGPARGRSAAPTAGCRRSGWRRRSKYPGLKGYLQVVVGHHDGVAANGYGPNSLTNSFIICGCRPKSWSKLRRSRSRQRGLHRHRRLGQPVRDRSRRSAPSPDRSTSARPLVGPGGHAGSDPPRQQLAVGHRVVRAVGADLDAVARLVAGVVVAREPRRGAVGLAGDQHAVGQLLEADVAPKASDRSRGAAVAHVDRQRRARGQRRRQRDVQLAVRAC